MTLLPSYFLPRLLDSVVEAHDEGAQGSLWAQVHVDHSLPATGLLDVERAKLWIALGAMLLRKY